MVKSTRLSEPQSLPTRNSDPASRAPGSGDRQRSGSGGGARSAAAIADYGAVGMTVSSVRSASLCAQPTQSTLPMSRNGSRYETSNYTWGRPNERGWRPDRSSPCAVGVMLPANRPEGRWWRWRRRVAGLRVTDAPWVLVDAKGETARGPCRGRPVHARGTGDHSRTIGVHGHGGIVDLLGVDADGVLRVLELTRDRTPREVVAHCVLLPGAPGPYRSS